MRYSVDYFLNTAAENSGPGPSPFAGPRPKSNGRLCPHHHLPTGVDEAGNAPSMPYAVNDVPSKHDLGAAACTKRPTSCILVNPESLGADEKELYEKLVEDSKSENRFV